MNDENEYTNALLVTCDHPACKPGEWGFSFPAPVTDEEKVQAEKMVDWMVRVHTFLVHKDHATRSMCEDHFDQMAVAVAEFEAEFPSIVYMLTHFKSGEPIPFVPSPDPRTVGVNEN